MPFFQLSVRDNRANKWLRTYNPAVRYHCEEMFYQLTQQFLLKCKDSTLLWLSLMFKTALGCLFFFASYVYNSENSSSRLQITQWPQQLTQKCITLWEAKKSNMYPSEGRCTYKPRNLYMRIIFYWLHFISLRLILI